MIRILQDLTIRFDEEKITAFPLYNFGLNLVECYNSANPLQEKNRCNIANIGQCRWMCIGIHVKLMHSDTSTSILACLFFFRSTL